MAPTPIRVKGKGRKAKWTPPGQLSRPAKRQKTARLSEKLSIEHLPVEILERIFHFSQNLNFPRSSLVIGRALSHPSFLHELIVDAFEPTWDNWCGIERKEVSSYHGWRCDFDRYGGDADYQSQVLNCSWLTLGHIFEAQRRWYRRAGSLVVNRPPLERVMGQYQAHMANYRIIAEQTAGGGCFGNTWQLAQPACAVADVFLDIHPHVRIPDRLLGGGSLTSEDVDLLLWLVLNGAQLHENQTWEPAFHSFRDLAADRDFQILPDHGPLLLALILYAQLGLFSMEGFVHWFEFVAKTAAPSSQFFRIFHFVSMCTCVNWAELGEPARRTS